MSSPNPIPWAEVHRRLEKVRVALERGFSPSSEEERAILKARAAELARKPEASRSEAQLLRVVAFELADESYAFELTSVREVCLFRELTPVPCTPPFVAGIVNLRGEIRTVIDLRRLFDLPPRTGTDANRILIIQDAEMRLGVLADAVRGVRCVHLEDLQVTLPTLTGIRAAYLRGVTSDRIAVLDAKRIVGDDRLLVRDEVEV